MTSRNGWKRFCGWCLLVAMMGCGGDPAGPRATKPSAAYVGAYDINANDIRFLDEAEANTEAPAKLSELSFQKPGGEEQKLADLCKGKYVVLVVTRGYAGSICPYCSTQTSRLMAGYPKFQERQAEVVVVYPLETAEHQPKLDDFIKRVHEIQGGKPSNVPFPLLLDVGLKAVDTLGIRSDLSKPATYILDCDGNVKYAYVGNSLSDRPSVKSLLEQLDRLNTPERPADAGRS